MSKVTKKTAKKVIAKKGRPKSEFPRGYNVEAIDKHLTIDGVSGIYGVYKVEHKALPNPKIFIVWFFNFTHGSSGNNNYKSHGYGIK